MTINDMIVRYFDFLIWPEAAQSKKFYVVKCVNNALSHLVNYVVRCAERQEGN